MPREKRRKTEFGTLTPKYPEYAYAAVLFLSYQELIDIFPLNKIFDSLDEASEYIREFINETEFSDSEVKVMDVCTVIPIRLGRLYSLKQEYWDNPHVEYTYEDRQHLFAHLATNPEMYRLLVTPQFYDDETREWELTASLPLRISTPKKTIEQFMLNSDEVVDERAKFAAIYDVLGGKRFNWREKELIPFEKNKSEKAAN